MALAAVRQVVTRGEKTVGLAPWPQFFALRFPLAMLVIAAIAEALAAALSGVTPHRHNVDDLANAVLHDQHPYRVVLLGDSVTHNVAHKYRIGDVNEVADLTTHAKAGLASSLFLLKRYVESGHHPQHVVLAISRQVLVYRIDSDTFDYYLTSVFREPYEREFLQKNYPKYVDYSWRPAALSMTTRIGEPLFSLLRHPGDDIYTAPAAATPHPVLDRFPDTPETAEFRDRVEAPEELLPEVRAVLAEMGALAQQHQFQLHVFWAPLELHLRAALLANGKLQHVDAQLAALFAAGHAQVSIEDSSTQLAYPYFDHDLIHIRGEGWEQAFANQLTALVQGLDGQASKPVAEVR
jgi:hypothetical protein